LAKCWKDESQYNFKITLVKDGISFKITAIISGKLIGSFYILVPVPKQRNVRSYLWLVHQLKTKDPGIGHQQQNKNSVKLEPIPGDHS
jgi:hypothetical protein